MRRRAAARPSGARRTVACSCSCSCRCSPGRVQAADSHRGCRRYGISRRHLQRLLARYREGGLDALKPRSRRPKTTPIATPVEVRARVVELRAQLSADGLDASPETIRWHLEREGLRAPSTSRIRRILHEAGLVTPQPRKRPPVGLHPLAARGRNRRGDPEPGRPLPLPAGLHVHEPVTGDDVVAVFLGVVEEYDRVGGGHRPADLAAATDRWRILGVQRPEAGYQLTLLRV